MLNLVPEGTRTRETDAWPKFNTISMCTTRLNLVKFHLDKIISSMIPQVGIDLESAYTSFRYDIFFEQLN